MPNERQFQGWNDREAVADFSSDSPFGPCVGTKGLGEYGEIFMDYAVQNNGTDIRIYNYKIRC